MNVRGQGSTPTAPHVGAAQVIVAHDLQEGDYLPDYGSTVHGVEVRTERFGVEWVDVVLSDQRHLVLDGYDDIAATPSTAGSTLSPRR